MSIIIQGMEMPTSPILFCIHPDGKVFADLEGGWREYKSVPVPPHGRLIDADELDTSIFQAGFSYAITRRKLRYTPGDVRQKIANAPTVIEAEEGET